MEAHQRSVHLSAQGARCEIRARLDRAIAHGWLGLLERGTTRRSLMGSSGQPTQSADFEAQVDELFTTERYLFGHHLAEAIVWIPILTS